MLEYKKEEKENKFYESFTKKLHCLFGETYIKSLSIQMVYNVN